MVAHDWLFYYCNSTMSANFRKIPCNAMVTQLSPTHYYDSTKHWKIDHVWPGLSSKKFILLTLLEPTKVDFGNIASLSNPLIAAFSFGSI